MCSREEVLLGKHLYINLYNDVGQKNKCTSYLTITLYTIMSPSGKMSE